MGYSLNEIIINNFKSFKREQHIKISDMSVFMGANSSGKSTALQALLLLKQTVECNSSDIDLLLSGKYVTLGTYEDICNDETQNQIVIGLGFLGESPLEEDAKENVQYNVKWQFVKAGDKSGHIKLNKIVFETDSNIKVSLCYHKQTNLYQCYIENRATRFFYEINNLIIKNKYISYGIQHNRAFAEFLQYISEELIENKKKNVRISKDEFVMGDAITNFIFKFARKGLGKLNIQKGYRKEEELAKKILDLIDEYARYLMPEYSSIDEMVPVEYLKTSIVSSLLERGNYTNVNKNVEGFYKRYIELSDLKEEYAIALASGMYPFYTEIDDKNSALSNIYLFQDIYDTVNVEILNKIFYVGPLREKPQGLYNIGFESIPRYVGPTGANFASVLLNERKEKMFIFPEEISEGTLSEALDEWACYINVADSISIMQSNSFGFNVHISNTQRVDSDIMNVGIGTSQVLPVLIMGLIAEKGETLIFEQPELHLYPYSQSRLADFFIALAKNGRKVIVESHSEYLVLRLRYFVASGIVNPEMIKVNFFKNEDGTEIKEGVLTGNGMLEYPDDFKDETQRLLSELLMVNFKKE